MVIGLYSSVSEMAGIGSSMENSCPNRGVAALRSGISSSKYKSNLTAQAVCEQSAHGRSCRFARIYRKMPTITSGEVLLVERRAIGENRLKIAVTAPNSVDFFPGHNALMAASWTGRICPKFLESPLDASIERLRIDFDDAQLNQLPKHPAERWLSRRHIGKLAAAQCNYTVFPHLCIRATLINQHSSSNGGSCWLRKHRRCCSGYAGSTGSNDDCRCLRPAPLGRHSSWSGH